MWRGKDEDALSEKGAHSLAKKIREYWWRRGVPIEVWVEPGRYARGSEEIKTGHGPAFWVVRSNIDVSAVRFD